MSCLLDTYNDFVKDGDKTYSKLEKQDREVTVARNWSRTLLAAGTINKVEATMMDYVAAKTARGDMVMSKDGKEVIKQPILLKKDGRKVTVTMKDGTEVVWLNGRSRGKSSDGTVYSSEAMSDIENQLGSEQTDDWIFDEGLGRGRKKTVKERLAGYAKVDGKDFINEPDAVKNLIDNLVEMEAGEVSKEEVDFLKETVDMIADPIAKYGREMNVYIREKAQANGGFIDFSKKTGGIYLSTNANVRPIGNELSVAQRYVHELVHGVTHFAYNYGSSRLTGTISRLKEVHNEVMNTIDWKVFMPEVSVDYDEEKKIAKARYDYINSSDNAMEEFIAYAMTHKPLRDAMANIKVNVAKESTKGMNLWEKFKFNMNELLKWAFEKARKEDKDTTADQLVMKLTKDLMSANDLAVNEYNKGIVRDAMVGLETAEDKWVEFTEGISEYFKGDRKWLDGIMETIPSKDQPFRGAVWLLKNSWKLWANPEFRPYFSNIMEALFMPKLGTVQTALRHLSDTDAFQDKLEELGLARNKIEQARMRIKQNVRNSFRDLWGRKFTKAEEKIITMGILKTDIGALGEDYSVEEIAELLKDPKKVRQEYEKVLAKISPDDVRAKRYKTAQIRGLAEFMVTGKSSDIQHMNAYMIENMVDVNGYDSGKRVAEDNDKVMLVDKATTLYALMIQSDDIKKGLKKLAEENVEGLLAYGNHMNEFVGQQFEFPEQKLKGWVKEQFNSDITSKIAPISMQDEMEEAGYTLVDTKLGYTGSSISKNMGLFVNRDKLLTNYNVSAMGLTDSAKHQGATLFDNAMHRGVKTADAEHKRMLKMLKAKGTRKVDAILNGESDSTFSPVNLIAVRSESGKVLNYVYGMTQVQKQEHLEMDMNPSEIMGAMRSTVYDQKETDKLNNKLVDELVLEMAREFDENELGDAMTSGDSTATGLSGQEYTRIYPGSESAKVQEIWKVMPVAMKNKVLAQEEGVWVREEALHDAFGFRSGSLVDLDTLGMLPAGIKKLVRQFEKTWQDIVKTAKVDIIIRVPAVLLGNIISNTMYLMQLGFNPKRVFTMQANGIIELNKYVDTANKIERLKAKKISIGLNTQERNELARLEVTVKDGSISELVDAGLYQSIVEDVSPEDLEISSKIHQKGDKLLDDIGAPEWVKTGTNWLYVNEKTSLFQWLQKGTQYSDFMARYAAYHMGLERSMRKFKRKNGRAMNEAEIAKSKKALLKDVTAAFINYSKPDSVFLQWMNDAGMIMFTKYVMRIQKVWKDGVAKHPISFLLVGLGQEIVGDIDDISDQMVMNKGLEKFFYSPEVGDLITRTFVPVAFRPENLN